MRRLFLLVIVVLAPWALEAQGRLLPGICRRACPPGRICPPCGPAEPAIVRTASKVDIRLRDGVLHYEITETFTNRGVGLGEADYLFPLPRGAAFQDLKLSIDGKLVAGEILNAGQAREIYESIVRSQKDPALVEWMGTGLLRARIFPLNAGESRDVVVRYQTIARREGDALRVDYFRGTEPGAHQDQRVNVLPELQSRERKASGGDKVRRDAFLLTFSYPDDARYGTAYSPTNQLDPMNDTRTSRNDRRFTVRGDARDVTILVPVRSASLASVTMLPHATGNGDGFAMITLSPPAIETRVTPRDVTVVIDVSGSMSGQKIIQARAAVRQLLETLTPQDRFRLIDFSSDVRTFQDNYVAATSKNLQDARRYVDALEASGSTNISDALTSALQHRPVAGRLPLVLFVTDGAATVGETNPERIAAHVLRRKGDTRIFTFGLGSDVNVAMIEQLALQGRGTAHFVRPDESIEEVLSLVARRLTNPLVTDLRVRAEGVQLVSSLPGVPSDVFAGQDLVILTRYRGDGNARIIFEGTTPNGPVRWTHTVHFPDRNRDNAFVARLWATQRIGYLVSEKRKHGESSEVDDEIRSLGERFGIPTEFSSYLVVEPGMNVALQSASGSMVAKGVRGGVARGVVGGTGSRDANAPEAAFASAKRASEQRSVRSLADADAVTEKDFFGRGSPVRTGPSTTPSYGTTRRVGDRVFLFRDSVWTDLRSRGKIEVVRIQPYSEAYFSVLATLPDIASSFALGDRVIIVGQKVVIELAPSGVNRLSDAQLDGIKKRW